MPIAPTPTKPQQETEEVSTKRRQETDLQRAGRLATIVVEDDPTVRDCTGREARRMIYDWLRPIIARARGSQHGSTSIRHREMFRDEFRPTRQFEIFRSVMSSGEYDQPNSAHEAIEAFVLRGDEVSLLYTCSDDPEHPWARISLIQGE